MTMKIPVQKWLVGLGDHITNSMKNNESKPIDVLINPLNGDDSAR